MSDSTNGVIHDIGYQRYRGLRLGRGYAVRSLYQHSLRTAFGLGRSAKAKIFPWLVVALVAGPAAVLVAIEATIGVRLISYVELVDQVSILLILFCAVVAPELVSRDLRSGVLPLYFSRPLRRGDYALAKLAALVSATWLLVAGPLVLMYVGAVFTQGRLAAVWEEAGEVLSALAYGLLVAVLFGAIALLIASLMGRRAVAAGAVVAVFVVSLPIVGVLGTGASATAQQLAGMASPTTLVIGVQRWLFDTPPELDIGPYGPLYLLVTLGVAAAGTALLLLRYRKVTA